MTQPAQRRIRPPAWCSRCGRRIGYDDEGGVCKVCGHDYCSACMRDGRCIECEEEKG